MIMKNTALYLLLFMCAWTACRNETTREQIPDKILNVKVQPVHMLEYTNPVRATGFLGTSKSMKLSFKTGGILKALPVKEGEQFRRGDVLAELDLSEIQAQVNQARIGVEKAERDLTRAANLYRDSVVTLEQYQNAESAYELAKSQKQVADFNLRHSLIKAPTNGTVQKLLAETNEVIGAGYPVLLFASTESDWVVRTTLTDKDIVKLALGDSGRVYMDAFPNKIFRGEIIELGSVADPVTGTYEAEFLIPKALSQFRTGFICRVELYPAETSRSLAVPIESLVDASDRSAYVFVYEEGMALKRRLRIGAILNEQVEVLEGLTEGELVITEGSRFLGNDEQVNVVNLKEADLP
jgi:RND family efflux transporter MFP subunit